MSLEKSTDGADGVEEAEQVVADLRTALADVGVVLPSLRLDLVTFARPEPAPLVDLGACPPPTARRLTAVLRTRAEDRR